MLIKFDPETTKQYRIYASDLKKCIKIFIITFFENVQKGEIDLKLSNFTSNELMIRNFKKRLKKTLLRFSFIEHKIDIIKNISIDPQQFTNSIMSSSKSKKNEDIRKKKRYSIKRRCYLKISNNKRRLRSCDYRKWVIRQIIIFEFY